MLHIVIKKTLLLVISGIVLMASIGLMNSLDFELGAVSILIGLDAIILVFVSLKWGEGDPEDKEIVFRENLSSLGIATVILVMIGLALIIVG